MVPVRFCIIVTISSHYNIACLRIIRAKTRVLFLIIVSINIHFNHLAAVYVYPHDNNSASAYANAENSEMM